ncbi:MAG: hypothetical protein SH868_14280 [Bythopirellula sp.]|nr:hypothetical protein [Bythopirellula sp.]
MNALRFSKTTAALAVVALTCASVSAGTIWDGGGANDYWTTGANWNGLKSQQVAPPNNGTADIVLPAINGLVQTPLVNVPYSIKSLRFDNGNGRFVVLCDQELTIGAGGVTNNDTDMQSVIGPMKLAANQTWTAAAGRLQMDQVNLNGFNLNLEGTHQIDLISLIGGSGGLAVADAYTSTVTMTGPNNNTYTGLTDVQSGTLVLQRSNGGVARVAVPGDLMIRAGGTVRLGANEQIAESTGNDVTVLGGGLLDVNTRTETLASLLVTDGGEVKIGTGGKLSVSNAVVTGAGSKLTNAYGGKFYVGEVGTGTLDIMDQGKVTGTGFAYVGYGSGSVGVVNVAGDNSIWEASSYIGYQGSGTVNITNGGTMIGGGYLGYGVGSTGIVNVDGIGSSWNGPGVVGYGGTGIVNVTNGGFVYSSQTIIGGSGAGNVSIDGPGSYWYSNYDIQVYKGELAVTDEALVVSAMPMLVNSLGKLSGNGTIGSDVMSRGLVAPGPGTDSFSIDGYYTQQPTGVLEIELGGADDYDQLLCNPNTYIATLDGTLEVKLVDGFTPLIGQSFTILTSYDVDGEFANLLLPSLPGRRFDVIYNPQSVVLEVNFDFGAGFANDGDGDGDVDGRDFLAWQRQFGSSAPLATSVAVPEPGALVLAVGGLLVGAAACLRRPFRRPLLCS